MAEHRFRSAWLSRSVSLAAAALTASMACSAGSTLINGESSPDRLAAAVLEALERRDQTRLQELALSEQEFREIVWPELPAARPERNLPFSYVWGDLKLKSDAALAGLLNEYGGRALVLTDLWFRGGSSQYESYVVHRTATLRVFDEAGVDHELQLFGSIVEHAGRFKLFSYVVD